MISKELDKRLGKALELAERNSNEFVTLEHFIFALIESPLVLSLLEIFQVSASDLKKELNEKIQLLPQLSESQKKALTPPHQEWQPQLTLAMHRVFERAAIQVQNAAKNELNEIHILIALFDEKNSPAKFCLEKFGLDQFNIIQELSHGELSQIIEQQNSKKSKLSLKDPFSSQMMQNQVDKNSDENDSQDSENTKPYESARNKDSALLQYGLCLNDFVLTEKYQPLIGREKELEKMIHILARKNKNNPLLVGDSGVGKSALVEGLAEKINQNKVPEFLQNKLIYSIDMGALISGAKFRGEFESRLKKIIKEASERSQVILFFDDMQNLVSTGSTQGSSMDASQLIKPALSRGEINCIGATTFQNYRQTIEKDSGLQRRFQKIDITETNRIETLEIVQQSKTQFENFYQIKFNDEALIHCVDLSKKYITTGKWPDMAIDLLDEVGAFAKLKNIKQVSEELVLEVIAKKTGVPNADVTTNDLSLLKDLNLKLKSLIFGQDDAIESLVQAIKASRSGLEPQEKPLGSFLFAGPTGVGKTEVCKQISRLLGIHFQRFDMSEYMEKHTLSRLIGAPPGYVGYDQGGQLTEVIAKHPYSLILLDEIEKAHSDIYNILLQIMDAGRLTDNQGRTVDFKNCLIVMTSNAGASEIAKGALGLTPYSQNQKIGLEAIKKTFSPEFINRLDKIIYFNPLSQELILKVAEKFLNELKLQISQKKINLSFTERVIQKLSEVGFDPVYGARPMSRKINELIKTKIVDEVLFGGLKNGGHLNVDYEPSSDQSSIEFKFSITPNLTPHSTSNLKP